MKLHAGACLLAALAGCGLPGDGIECPHAPELLWSDLNDQASYPAVGLTRDRNCTVFLIAPTLAVTAAHCVDPDRSAHGAYFRNPVSGAWRLYAGRMIPHPNYGAEAYFEEGVSFRAATADIAVIKLDQPVDDVQPAELGTTGDQPGVCAPVVVVGYAPSLSLAEQVEQSMATAVVWVSPKVFRIRGSSRPGDSGGPVFSLSNGRAQVIGLVESRPVMGSTSYSTYCANLLSPEPGYHDWILSQ